MLRDILEQVADTLRDALNDNTGLDIQVEPRLIPSPSTPVCVDVYPGAPSRDSEAAGFDDIAGAYVLTVRARVNVNDQEASQDILVDMIDDVHELSIAAALDADPTLNGYTTSLYVDSDGFSGLQLFPSADGPSFIGCTWRLLVMQAVS